MKLFQYQNSNFHIQLETLMSNFIPMLKCQTSTSNSQTSNFQLKVKQQFYLWNSNFNFVPLIFKPLEFQVECENSSFHFKVETLNWSSKLKFKSWVWRWSLKLKFKLSVWHLSLKLQFDIWDSSWSLKFEFTSK